MKRRHCLRTCALEMKVAADGDVVAVRYRGTLDDGSVFDENPDGPFLEFEVGSGRVIKGFDEAVRGLAIGESREVRCLPGEAYGEYDANNLATIPRPEMPDPPPGMELKAGMMLQLENGQVAVVKEVSAEDVILDGNHPLAGKTLNFKVTLHEIKDGEEVAKLQRQQMLELLDAPLIKILAPEITKDADYVAKTKAQLEAATDSDCKASLAKVVESREWRAIAGALASNPQLQQLLEDPTPLQQADIAVAPLDPNQAPSPKVAEAEFSEDV